MPTSVDPPSIQADLDAQVVRIKARVEKALAAAAAKMAENAIERGRSDISGAGAFGTRWTSGFTYEITGTGDERVVSFRQEVPYWRIFQYGGIIKGKPLLWIPLSWTGVKVRARDFPGRLFRVNRKSGAVPLLMSVADKKPIYHGQTSVRIPKKFHLVEIIRAESKTLGALYRLEMTQGK